MSTLGAALVGAAVGAAAVVFSNEQNRKKVKKAFGDFKQNGDKKIKQLKEKVEDTAQESREKLADTLDEAEKNVRKREPKRT